MVKESNNMAYFSLCVCVCVCVFTSLCMLHTCAFVYVYMSVSSEFGRLSSKSCLLTINLSVALFNAAINTRIILNSAFVRNYHLMNVVE